MTSHRAVASPVVSSRLGLVFSLCAGALLALAPQAASAQGRMDAHYEATLSGIPVGKGAWTIEIGDDTFSASAQGGTAGLLKAFWGGTGAGASQGRVVNGALIATAYTATTTTQKKSETIRLLLANGNVKDFSIDPAPPVDPDRSRRHRGAPQGRLDPMTGSMLRVPGNGEVLSPEACRTGAGIFDGRPRYDLKLDYKRMETVKAERAITARRWSARSTSRRSRAISRPSRHQISRHRAPDRDRVRADRGNPRPGSIPHDHPDTVRPGDAGGDAVHHRCLPAPGGEDELSSLRRRPLVGEGVADAVRDG